VGGLTWTRMSRVWLLMKSPRRILGSNRNPTSMSMTKRGT
jgi:hypothetical protein